MSEPVYAVIPLRLEAWKTGENLSADCLNDLHSSNSELCQIYGEAEFLAYDDNLLRFKTTEDSDYQLPCSCQTTFSGRVLVDVSFFMQNDYCSRSSLDHFEIMHVTARELVKLASVVRQHVS